MLSSAQVTLKIFVNFYQPLIITYPNMHVMQALLETGSQMSRCQMSGAKCRVQNVGCQMSGAKRRVPNVGCQMSGAKCQVPNVGCQTSGAKCRVPNVPVSNVRESNVGCQMSGCQVSGAKSSGAKCRAADLVAAHPFCFHDQGCRSITHYLTSGCQRHLGMHFSSSYQLFSLFSRDDAGGGEQYLRPLQPLIFELH